MITVLILIGILAFTALPHLFDQSTFESRGFRDQSLSILRYAQKSAIAQRRTVCVSLAATAVTVSIASAADSLTCDTALALPNPNPRAGSGLTANVTGFRYLPEGGTDQTAANVLITIAGASAPINVDKVTGYVY